METFQWKKTLSVALWKLTYDALPMGQDLDLASSTHGTVSTLKLFLFLTCLQSFSAVNDANPPQITLCLTFFSKQLFIPPSSSPLCQHYSKRLRLKMGIELWLILHKPGLINYRNLRDSSSSLVQQPMSVKACLYPLVGLAFSDKLIPSHSSIVSPTYGGAVYLGIEHMTGMFLSRTSWRLYYETGTTSRIND